MAQRGVNKVILIGNLGKDPETRGDGNITNITIATSESWKDKQSGEQQERTEWHRVVFFGKLADIAAQYLKKGSKVFIEGQLRTRKWQDSTGKDNYTTEIVASEMQMLDGPQGRDANNGGQQRQAPAQQRAPQQQAAGQGQFDDDIPF